jgi:uncharacterized OsmC-like protein
MATVTARYLGDLRVEAIHNASGTTIISDAPPDNSGQGRGFSPTDLTVTSLGMCAMTIMGLYGKTHGLDLAGMSMDITKTMSKDAPRRIAEITILFTLPDRDFSAKQKQSLERAALACPVHQSLHPEVAQKFEFNWVR